MHVTDKAGKKGRRVNAAVIILVMVPAAEAGTDVESAIMAVTVVITKAVQQQAHACLFPFFKLSRQKKEIAIFLRRRKKSILILITYPLALSPSLKYTTGQKMMLKLERLCPLR